jgi:hypothetical protein
LARTVAQCDCFELTYSRLDEAVSVLGCLPVPSEPGAP